MKPLRDVEDGSPLVQDAQRLLNAAPPTAESMDRMQRVRRAIDAREAAAAGSFGRPLRTLSIALGVLLVAGSALAAVSWYFQVPNPSVVVAVPPHRYVARPIDPADATASDDTIAPETDHATSTPKKTRASTARPRPEPEATAPEPSRDSALVHQAMKALRRDHDAATAARLLSEQRTTYPQSALAEEALSLQIEAAVALQDPRARELATLYVARYPNGRYVAIAARALKSQPQ